MTVKGSKVRSSGFNAKFFDGIVNGDVAVAAFGSIQVSGKLPTYPSPSPTFVLSEK